MRQINSFQSVVSGSDECDGRRLARVLSSAPNDGGLDETPRPPWWTVDLDRAIVLSPLPTFFTNAPSRYRWMAVPGKPGSLGQSSRPVSKYRPMRIGSRDASQREKVQSHPCGLTHLRWGDFRLWMRRPRLQSPYVMYCQKSIAASFGLPSLPVRGQSTPRFYATSTSVLVILKHESSPH